MWKRNVLSASFLLTFVGWLPTFALAAQEVPAGQAPKSHRMPMMYKLSYNCDEGKKVLVFLRERNARVMFAGKSYAMKQVQAASGMKYSDGALVWWSKGEEGFLEDETSAARPVRLADNCKLEKKPSMPEAAVISGTVTYRERIAMPENAVLTMQLQDVSQTDAPAKVIAEQKFTFAGHQVPLPFELHYDPAKIDSKHAYALSARIEVNGQLMFANTTAYRVITQGNPTKADLLLQMVEGQKKSDQP